jgi:DHA1 family multidrug resistance protein-like MFS transporter
MAETGKNRNLRVASAAKFLSGLGSMSEAVWQPFVLSFGLPVSMLGFLETLGSFKGIATSLLYPVAGWLADRLGRKPIIIVGALGSLLAFTLYLTAALTGEWWLLVPGVILLGVGFAADPAFNSLVAESTHASRRGTAFSIMMVAWTAPAIFLPILGGLITDRLGFAPVYLIRVVLDAIRLLLFVWLIRETLTIIRRVRTKNPRAGAAFWSFVMPPKGLRAFYLATALDSFVWGLGFSLLFGMLSDAYGFTTFQFGIMTGLRYLVVVVTQMPIGRLVDRLGYKAMLIASEVIGVVVLIGLLFSRSFLDFTLSQALFGLCVSTWVPAQMALQSNSVPEEVRGQSLGRLAGFKGIIGAFGPSVGGLLYDHYGFHTAILANLIGLMIPTALFIFAVRDPLPAGQSPEDPQEE